MMQNIRIKNAENGGFLITEDHELYGTPIAALSNSGDLIRWMTEQFIKPKEEPIFPHFKPMLDRVLAREENAPEPEQDGFITKEPEWISWGITTPFRLNIGDLTKVEIQTRQTFLYIHAQGLTGVYAYRVLS